MPTFTIELWRMIEFKPDDVELYKWLGLDAYPIFDESYREKLNSKIINHFMFQEIGHETMEQFTFRMRARMNEIMPPYNELYESTLKKFDPLITMDILNTSKGLQDVNTSGNSESDTTSKVGSKSKNVVSNFPQVPLSPNKDYATNGADAISESDTTGRVGETQSAESKTASEGESRTLGYQGSPASLIQSARSLIINVDMMVIQDIDPLFMAVWNNGDDYATEIEL